MPSLLSRFVPRNLIPQRIHTERLLRDLWQANTGANIDEIFRSCGMDDYSVKNTFDILDEKFGQKLKSNDHNVLEVVIPEALYALAQVTEHYDQATQSGTRPYRA